MSTVIGLGLRNNSGIMHYLILASCWTYFSIQWGHETSSRWLV